MIINHYKKQPLIYIEPSYNEEFNQAIAENYDFIVDSFNGYDIPFVYLPKLLTDSHFNRVLGYNQPHLEKNHDYSDKLYHVISNSLNLNLDTPALIFLSESGKVEHKFDLISPKVFTAPNNLFLFAEHIYNTIHPSIDEEQSIKESFDIRFRIGREEKLFESSFDYALDIPSKKDSLAKSHKKKSSLDAFKKKKKTADELFEEEAFKIPDDLQQQIEELSQAGYLSHLIKYLEILQQTTRRLSRLKITNDHRIYLMDYEMKEVIMSPLPKALYLLFLNHPQGITFKELPDYRAELMEIYKNISLRENPIKARRSIRKLTDPLDNSVHEKCSRIRAAFLSVVAEDIAQNYFVTGGRGEPKKVSLNRELVIYTK